MKDENLGKMQGIGAKMSQEEVRAELRHYNEEISHCSAYNLDSNRIEPVLSRCSEKDARILLAAAQKHEADTPQSPETLTKEKKRATFEGVTARGDMRERERNKEIPIVLEDSHQD